MPLSIPVLKGLIVSEIMSEFPTIADAATLDKFATAIATAVVTHITTSATVPPGISVDPVTFQTITPGQVL